MTAGFIITFVGFVLIIRALKGESVDITAGGPRVAVVELLGPIYDSRSLVRQFKKYERDDRIDAIVFRIESPGGGVAPSQEIYSEVRRVRETGKVIVASMGSVAASGGYYVALGAGMIVANRGTLTGSIGVIMGMFNYTELLKKIGLAEEAVKSGRYKDSGAPYREMTEDEREYFQGLVNDVYAQFVEDVAWERGLELDDVREIADGRVYSGEQAYDIGLVDTLGTYEDAIRLAVELAGLEGRPRIIRERKGKPSIFDLIFGDAKEVLGYLQGFPAPEYRLFY